MGYLIVPDLNDETVVCQQPCQHTDCIASRLEWEDAKCCDCRRSFKAGDHFYYCGRPTESKHQCIDCAFREAEAQQKGEHLGTLKNKHTLLWLHLV